MSGCCSRQRVKSAVTTIMQKYIYRFLYDRKQNCFSRYGWYLSGIRTYDCGNISLATLLLHYLFYLHGPIRSRNYMALSLLHYFKRLCNLPFLPKVLGYAQVFTCWYFILHFSITYLCSKYNCVIVGCDADYFWTPDTNNVIYLYKKN